MNSTELAKAITAELLSGGSVWLFLLLTAFVAGAGSYFGKYLGVKAANLATKEDFNSLHDQLGASTRLVEGVKSQIGRADWIAREWGALRIKKIEELMTILYACEDYLKEYRVASMEGKFYPNSSPFDQAMVISELYLPELQDAVKQFILACREISIIINALAQITMKNNAAGVDSSYLWDSHVEEAGYANMFILNKNVRKEASHLLQKIVSSQESS